MPLTPCQHEQTPGWRWGETGKCYTYDPESPLEELQARESALRQGRAIVGRRDALRPPGPDVPVGVQRDLEELYTARTERLKILLRAAVKRGLGVRVDATPIEPQLGRLTAEQIARVLLESLSVVTPEEERALDALGRRTLPYVADRSTESLSRLLGSPVPRWWGFLPDEVEEEIGIFRRWNSELLVDVTERYGQEVQADVIRAVIGAGDVEDVVESLVSRYEISLRRGAFIARDQTTKLARGLERGRHEAVGILGFYWRSVGDGRVRLLHRQREGVLFLYADGPPSETDDDGWPGTPIGCRCFEEPQIEGVVLHDLGDPAFTSPVGGNPPPVEGWRIDPTSGLWVPA